jgi:hypothetical protein
VVVDLKGQQVTRAAGVAVQEIVGPVVADELATEALSICVVRVSKMVVVTSASPLLISPTRKGNAAIAEQRYLGLSTETPFLISTSEPTMLPAGSKRCPRTKLVASSSQVTKRSRRGQRGNAGLVVLPARAHHVALGLRVIKMEIEAVEQYCRGSTQTRSSRSARLAGSSAWALVEKQLPFIWRGRLSVAFEVVRFS